MDAREQLRRYLEQRREMGETELVLDGMSVEDALRILGGSGSGKRRSPAGESDRQAPAPMPSKPASTVEVNTGDWRETLRSAGAEPASRPGAPIPPSPPSPPSSPSRETVEEAEPAPSRPMTGDPRPSTADPRPSNFGAPAGISAKTPASVVIGGSLAALDSLEAVAQHVSTCTRCSLYSTAKNHVPGEGNPLAELMCVGEAPGATEDETGRPFVGAAGQLLTKILEAIQLPREKVFICNVLKHRPPGNRNPLPEEVIACSPYLIRQIELIRPKVIIALGTFAAQTLLDTKLSIGKLRGQVHRYHGVPLVVTYHPAALLRNPNWKRPTWEDVQLARRILDSANNSGA